MLSKKMLKKVNAEILKAMEKRLYDKCGQFPCYAELDNNNVFITNNGFSGYVLHKSDLLFDLEKMSITQGLADIVKGLGNLIEVEKTGEMKIHNGKTLVKIGDKWVDDKLLKPFLDAVTYKESNDSNSKKSIVYIYNENDLLIGIVMPTRV